MPPLAHSERKERGIPSQEYRVHIEAVETRAAANVAALAKYAPKYAEKLQASALWAARFHDLGKLDDDNQAVLRVGSRNPLPVAHEYAGAHHLFGKHQHVAAALAYYHHSGLKNLAAEITTSKPFRHPLKNNITEEGICRAAKLHTKYAAEHIRLFPNHALEGEDGVRHFRELGAYNGLFWRLALSCLVDADHGDTASNYQQEADVSPVQCRWAERSEALERHVQELRKKGTGDPRRQRLRQEFYEACRDGNFEESMYACDGPVGTGKTTAIMAHLLKVARERGLRRIIVVLPYTNIINQSVKVYREALCLDGEQAEQVVAAHHHLADYSDLESRQLATLWNCPIVVTTAVQFFESLAASSTARLRKLHQLPGSGLLFDEAHAAIPVQLWPQTWKWLRELTTEWSCHAVLASGSLARFWETGGLLSSAEQVPDLIQPSLRQRLHEAEHVRVRYQRVKEPMRLDDVVKFVAAKAGPRLVIVNTLVNAAIVARKMKDDGMDVMHLSTALAPIHRAPIVKRIQERLKHTADSNWTLVATSCVEAGVDLSFVSGIREAASACSLLQVAGRVNREGENGSEENAVWTVTLTGQQFTKNRQLDAATRVLHALFEIGAVGMQDGSKLATEALVRELNEVGHNAAEDILNAETKRAYEDVSSLYRVIEDETVPVLVPPGSMSVEKGQRPDAQMLQESAVSVRRSALHGFNVREVPGYPRVYAWNLAYDPEFLGYMAGALTVRDSESLKLLTV